MAPEKLLCKRAKVPGPAYDKERASRRKAREPKGGQEKQEMLPQVTKMQLPPPNPSTEPQVTAPINKKGRKGKTRQPGAMSKGRTRQQAQGIPLGVSSTSSTSLSSVGTFSPSLFKEHPMPHDKLCLDIILSVPGLLSSHRTGIRNRTPPCQPYLDRIAASYAHLAHQHGGTCTRRAVTLSWRCFPASSETQAVTGTQEVLNRELMEEEVTRHKSVIYSDAFQALTAAEMTGESQAPTALPRLYVLPFPPNSFWAATWVQL